MPLADVLSAMREIILDAPSLPPGLAAREEFLRDRFPRLAREELQDLARIEPAKFSIYTVSIFQGEKGILDNHFPMTLELLKRHWSEAFGERFVGYQLTKKLHALRPWKSQKPLDFARNFADFLNFDCPALLALRPDIGSLARLEAETYQLRRAADPAISLRPGVDLSAESLAKITVAQLLQSKIYLNENINTLTLPHQVLALREYFYQHERTLPEASALQGDEFLIGTRAKNNAVLWHRVKRGIFHFFRDAAASKRQWLIEEFAEFALNDFPQPDDEAQALQFLIEQLALLSSCEFFTLEQVS